MTPVKDKEFSEKEAQARFEAALKGGLSTSPQPLKDKPKVKKARKKAKTATRPGSKTHRNKAKG